MTGQAVLRDGVQEEIDRIIDALAARSSDLAAAMVRNIQAEIPAYLRNADPATLGDVQTHCQAHATLILAVTRENREPLRGELGFARAAGARRVEQRIPIDSLLAAFRVGHRTVWDAILDEAAETPEGREAAIALARPAMEYIDTASTQVAEAYTRELAKREAAVDRERRDLIESLLSGRVPTSVPARVAPGLEQEASVVVAVATLTGPEPRPSALTQVAAAIAQQAMAARGAALVVERQHQVVAVVGTSRTGHADVLERLRSAWRGLTEGEGLQVRIGVGTECAGLAGVAHGFTEAVRALERATAETPVLALQEVAAFDYLVASAEPATREVVLAKGRALLEADERENGAVSATLLAYLDCDLNIKRAAEQLVVHPNTVRYRLRRIGELTGADPRHFSDLLELVTVVRMARG
jgi:DNA-binding PucR family transcriptional regulator